MSELKKKLAPHAVTCIKRAVLQRIQESSNHDLAYSAYCDREDCWDQSELIHDYMCVVNVRESGYTVGQPIQRTLSDKQVLCGNRAELTIEIEVYATGCDATADTAFSVLADVGGVLSACDPPGPDLFVKRLIQRSVRRETHTLDSTDKTRVVATYQADFDFMPCRPTLVFKRYKER